MKIFGKRIRRNQRGFTLVELLVVVGIIVALAAVIIPNVASFSDRGDTGARAAERDNIQAAIDTYMADNGYATIPGGEENDTALGLSSNNFTTASGILDLETSAYLRTPSTTFFYCWLPNGLVSFQDPSDPPAATVDCTRTN